MRRGVRKGHLAVQVPSSIECRRKASQEVDVRGRSQCAVPVVPWRLAASGVLRKESVGELSQGIFVSHLLTEAEGIKASDGEIREDCRPATMRLLSDWMVRIRVIAEDFGST